MKKKFSKRKSSKRKSSKRKSSKRKSSKRKSSKRKSSKRKYSKRKSNLLIGGDIVKIKGGGFGLTISNVGHSSIMYITPGSLISRECYSDLCSYISKISKDYKGNGVEGNYIISFTSMFGKNSALINPSTKLYSLLNNIFNDIVGILSKHNFASIIDTSRYPVSHGQPPPHIDISKNLSLFNKYFNNTNIKENVSVYSPALCTLLS